MAISTKNQNTAWKERLLDLTKRLDLGGLLEKRMGPMSSGERQRVHLGRVFLQETPLMLFDEPTNHLDPGAKKLFWVALIAEQRRRNAAALVVTHDLDFVRSWCQRVIAVKPDGVVFSGPASEFFEKRLDQGLYK